MKSRRHKKYATPAKIALQLRRDPKFAGKNRITLIRYVHARALSYPARFWGHLTLVARHKLYVLRYCLYAGIPWRGVMHDWSKFSPTEFCESVRYFNGKRSPVGLCRELNGGYSPAWLHHRGRNKHHFEYWLEYVDENSAPLQPVNSVRALPIPYAYALEMICDTIAANRAYKGKDFSCQTVYAWWTRQGRSRILHPATRKFCNELYELIHTENSFQPLKRAREIYERAMREEGLDP